MAMAAALAKVLRGGRARASQSPLPLLPAMGHTRGPQEGFVGRLLPRPGQTAPLVPAIGATAPVSTAASSRPLLRRVPSSFTVVPWRFHLMAGLQSFTHAGEQLAQAPPPSTINKEYVASIRNLEKDLENMDARIENLDSMKWLCVAFLMCYVTMILPDHLVEFSVLRKKNSKLARKLKKMKDQVAHQHKELRAVAAVTPVIPAVAAPSGGTDV